MGREGGEEPGMSAITEGLNISGTPLEKAKRKVGVPWERSFGRGGRGFVEGRKRSERSGKAPEVFERETGRTRY